MKRLKQWWDKFTIKVPKQLRIMLLILFAGILVGGIVGGIVCGVNNKEPARYENKENVYLYEEVEFADEIYIGVVGMNVIENNDTYTLNLKARVEQWNTDSHINKQIIRPDMFELRLIDKYAPSPMSSFFKCLANATVSAAASAMVDGEINVIEETLGLAKDYAVELIENAISDDSNTIKAKSDDFVSFYPYEKNGISTYIDLTFELNDHFLNSDKTIVLSIDDGLKRIQKNIFLVLRSNTYSYTIQFDTDGGSLDFKNKQISVNPGQYIAVPYEQPVKEGYKFLFWTTKKGKKAYKLRDLYFYSYEEDKVFTVYAYYQPIIPLDTYANIGDFILFKNNVSVKINSASYCSEATIRDSNKNEVVINSSYGNKYLAINLTLAKAKKGNDHNLDNDDDFFLKNNHAKKDAKKYYGFATFEKMKPIDDYSWIGLEIKEIKEYDFSLLFEVSDSFDYHEILCFLEVDFYKGKNADSILIR